MKKYYEHVFKIESYDFNFRFKKIKPTKLLSLSSLFGGDINSEEMEKLFDFALMNTQVLIVDKWHDVVESLPNGEVVYWPESLEDNLSAISEISSKFINDVIKVVFTKSNESMKKTL